MIRSKETLSDSLDKLLDEIIDSSLYTDEDREYTYLNMISKYGDKNKINFSITDRIENISYITYLVLKDYQRLKDKNRAKYTYLILDIFDREMSVLVDTYFKEDDDADMRIIYSIIEFFIEEVLNIMGSKLDVKESIEYYHNLLSVIDIKLMEFARNMNRVPLRSSSDEMRMYHDEIFDALFLPRYCGLGLLFVTLIIKTITFSLTSIFDKKEFEYFCDHSSIKELNEMIDDLKTISSDIYENGYLIVSV